MTGNIEYLELHLTDQGKVQRLSFKDESQTWWIGGPTEQATIVRYDFTDTKKWIGLHGAESLDGIEQLGIITMDPTCTPQNGIQAG